MGLGDRDARAFSERAGAIEALLDEPIAVAVQHAPNPGKWGGLCGSFSGQVLAMPIGVTCPDCLAKLAKRSRRGGR